MRYRILLEDKVEKDLLRKIKSKYNKDVEGIDKLYDSLIEEGTCDSDIVSRIYYVAYTLSLSDIKMMIVRLD